jgi:hypothetical protein
MNSNSNARDKTRKEGDTTDDVTVVVPRCLLRRHIVTDRRLTKMPAADQFPVNYQIEFGYRSLQVVSLSVVFFEVVTCTDSDHGQQENVICNN